MTYYTYITSSIRGDGSPIQTLAAGDTVFVASGVTVGTSSAVTAFVATTGDIFSVAGTIFSGSSAIKGTDSLRVSITATGALLGGNGIYTTGSVGDTHVINAGQIMTHGDALALYGSSNSVDNSGTISSDYIYAIFNSGDGLVVHNSGSILTADDVAVYATGSATIVNSGVISAIYGAAIQAGGAAEIHNSGSIEAGGGYAALTLAGTDDSVDNAGWIAGDVVLGGGDDSFDGHLGHVSGRVLGGAGNDLLIGSDTANDVLIGGIGADELIGGGGTMDVASYQDATAGLTADLQLPYKNTGDALGDTYSGIEGLRGSNFDDILYGDNGANRIVGGDGYDQIFGRDGNDVLQGGNTSDKLDGGVGNDRLDGGDGFDYASYEDATVGVSVSLAITGAQNTVGAGVDTLISIGGLIGSNYADKLTGSAGSDDLSGGAGNDVLYGGDSGTGSDVLDGGLGADQLYGQGGKDVFAFSTALSNAAFDTIHDFTVSDDRISLYDQIFTTLPTGTLDPNAFYIGAGAHDADDRIIYNDATGALLYDADGTGSGAAVEFALIAKHLALTSANIGVYGDLVF